MSSPGARWNPIYLRNDEPQVSDVLFDNPLAYILFPLALACAAAGAVETVLAYRKQRRA